MSAASTLAKDWTKPLPEEAEAAAKFEATLSSRRFDAKNPHYSTVRLHSAIGSVLKEGFLRHVLNEVFAQNGHFLLRGKLSAGRFHGNPFGCPTQ
jgi:hypothetical protein